MVKSSLTKPFLIRLQEGDLERLETFYPRKPYNLVIRTLVKAHLDRLELRLEKKAGKAPSVKEKDFE
jgi:hypothetical protein